MVHTNPILNDVYILEGWTGGGPLTSRPLTSPSRPLPLSSRLGAAQNCLLFISFHFFPSLSSRPLFSLLPLLFSLLPNPPPAPHLPLQPLISPSSPSSPPPAPHLPLPFPCPPPPLILVEVSFYICNCSV